MKKNIAGFSLVELIVVMSIIMTLLGLITINLTSVQQRVSLNFLAQTIISDIRQQQIKAMVGDTQGGTTSDSYGIHTDPNKYVLFKGTSYDPLASSNFKVDLSTNAQFVSPVLDIVFDRVSGDARFPTLTDGLVGYWRFNEGTGQTVDDSSDSNNDGTLGATSLAASDDPTWTTGKIGGALNFDGINDVVNVGSAASLDDINPITFCAWIYMRTLPSDPRIFAKSEADANIGWALLISNVGGLPNGLNLRRGFSTTRGTWRSSDSIVSATWQHVCFTYDNSSTANDPVFYIDDNVSATTELVTPSGTANSDASFNGLIGNRSDGLRPVDGIIDDVRIYNRVLSSAEIHSVYTGFRFQLQDTTNGNIKTVQMNQYGAVTSAN